MPRPIIRLERLKNQKADENPYKTPGILYQFFKINPKSVIPVTVSDFFNLSASPKALQIDNM